MKSSADHRTVSNGSDTFASWAAPGVGDFLDYSIDAWQRSILLLDVLRQRGNNSAEHNSRKAPHVLSFEAELVLDGRTLPRPVNYGLVRIIPPEGISSTRTRGRLSYSTRELGMAQASAA
jgi:hypothetical protein